MTRPVKHSEPWANLANAIEDHVARAWPELADVRSTPAGIWFTGSSVWRFLYPSQGFDVPRPRDWDLFTLDEPAARWIVETLGWDRVPSCQTGHKWGAAPRVVDRSHVPTLAPEPGSEDSGYTDGYSYATERGIVDLWISPLGSALAELRAYPTASHAHCRAAWSFADGLIVLPNESARGPAKTVDADADAPDLDLGTPDQITGTGASPDPF